MKEYICESEDIKIRKLQDTDEELTMLGKWRDDERVSRFYGGRDKDNSLEGLKKKYLPRIHGEKNMQCCIIEYKGQDSGYIQFFPLKKEAYKEHKLENYKNAYGIDIFIAGHMGHSKGLGSKSLKTLYTYLFNEKNADIVEICPRTVNERAVAAYKKAGFTPHSKLEKGEFFEGKWYEETVMIITK